MSAIVIRNIPEDVHARLRQLAAARKESVEAMVRQELVKLAAQQPWGVDFTRLAEARRAAGLVGEGPAWPEEFDDPAFSRKVLGLEDD